MCVRAMASYRVEPDAKVPVLADESVKEFKTYEKLVKAHVLSTTGSTDDEVKRKMKAMGPALYKNLIVMGNSISMLVEQLDVHSLAVEDGADILLKYLRDMRFSEGKLAQLPRVFRRFYKETTFRRGPTEPMASFIAEKMLAKAELEAADSGCKVSDSELAYWLLEHSMLAPEEKKYVLGQAGEADKMKEIRATLENL